MHQHWLGKSASGSTGNVPRVDPPVGEKKFFFWRGKTKTVSNLQHLPALNKRMHALIDTVPRRSSRANAVDQKATANRSIVQPPAKISQPNKTVKVTPNRRHV